MRFTNGLVSLITALLVALAGFAWGDQPQKAGKPLAVVPEATFEFSPVVEGKEVVHDYVIRNEGAATLDIAKVKTG